MPVASITREQFEAFGVRNECRSAWRAEHETEWYVDDAAQIIGAILLNPLSLRWGYVICRRIKGGAFHHTATGNEHRILKQAQQELLAAIGRLAGASSE